jgi:Gnt-I system high-affinity gluconate transporter
MFEADIGKILLYGTLLAIPAIIIAGPLFSKTLRKINAQPLKEFVNTRILEDKEMPGTWNSILTTLLPVILIGASSLSGLLLDEGQIIRTYLTAIGDPVIAMLISVVMAVLTLGIGRGRKIGEVMESLAQSIASITMVLLIIAGAGGLKQVLVDSGTSTYIAGLLGGSSLSPLLLGWIIAAVLRICVGSATVAGLTTAGIILPLAAGSNVNKELLVLSIGAGSLIFSHVNDGAFWMFKEYFSLSVKETFATWSVMETIISITGLAGVMFLNLLL